MDVIPKPRHLFCDRDGGGRFALDADTVLAAGPGTDGLARWLRGTLGAATGLGLPPEEARAGRASGNSVLTARTGSRRGSPAISTDGSPRAGAD